ncbi:hypothetical protein JRC04_17075 [Mycolicibacterium sp. S2-37]|uniref:hypothetical protein n=1 Tax=Mycolicibacterium sp. S2-37 TaxID=2810297 RepID=UPI001A942617|nr:hypothetical protein [Mycolicibacterium sp. S2-37]MBO0679179.1 hypothetical protein [Mycolicibacterium sp. S2-37]
MGYLDTAKDRAAAVAGTLVSKITDKDPADAANGQWVTVNCTVVEAEELWRDPNRMSVVLGELGEVEFSAPDSYRWKLHAGPVSTTWQSRVHSENGGLRFVGAGEDANEILVTYRPAPNGLGTELGLRTKTPAPDLLSGALAFKVLYRCRALLQTGEVPTIRSNPSARPSAR